MKKLFLLLLLLISATGFSQTSRDTITNWQVYKDNQLLFKSHLFDSKHHTATIKTSDKFTNLTIFINSDIRTNEKETNCSSKIREARVPSFIEIPDSGSNPVIISNKELKSLLGLNLNEEFTLEYADSPKSTIKLGTVKLTDK